MTPCEIKAKVRKSWKESGSLPMLSLLSAVLLLLSASLKSAVGSLFSLMRFGFLTSSELFLPSTPAGSLLAEGNGCNIDISAIVCDLLIITLTAPLFAGILRCVMMSVLSPVITRPAAFAAIGLFYSDANMFRRALTLEIGLVIRLVSVVFPFAAADIAADFTLTERLTPYIFCAAAFAVICFLTRYYAAAAIYVCDTSISYRGAMSYSAKLMKRHKTEAVLLMLSFTWGAVLSVVTAGIALLYVLPLFMCCYAEFAGLIGLRIQNVTAGLNIS